MLAGRLERRGGGVLCWRRTIVPRPVNIGDLEDRSRPMGRPSPSQNTGWVESLASHEGRKGREGGKGMGIPGKLSTDFMPGASFAWANGTGREVEVLFHERVLHWLVECFCGR